MKEITKTVFVAFDGKEFEKKSECDFYETQMSPEKKAERVGVILHELNRLKRSSDYQSLGKVQKRLDNAKAVFLAAAKKKRRYTMDFAKEMEMAAVFYRAAYYDFQRVLNRKRELVDELKRLLPKFDRRKGKQ